MSAEHQDCNGKGPGLQGPLLGEVYPQLNARKDKNDLEEDTEYVSAEPHPVTDGWVDG